jgi:hypothetical protein
VKTIFSSNRTYIFLAYSVSHSTLVIRSLKEGKDHSRIDIVFTNVCNVNICCELDGIEVASEDKGGMTSFTIKSNNFEGVVVGSSVNIFEDQCEYDDDISWDFQVPAGLRAST